MKEKKRTRKKAKTKGEIHRKNENEIESVEFGGWKEGKESTKNLNGKWHRNE